MRVKRTLEFFLFFLFIAAVPLSVQADVTAKRASQLFIKGRNYFQLKQYQKAIATFTKAYRALPIHPQFNCYRAQFLNYIGRSYEGLRKYYAAMRSYYNAAYRTNCRKKGATNYAIQRYNALYRRWMCSITVNTTPPKARLYMLTPQGDKLLGKTPIKKVLSPGSYRFKIRLYDHRTVFFSVKLRPGMHLRKHFKLVKGEDPINRPEKIDVAPPPPVASAKPKAAGPKKDTPKSLLGDEPTGFLKSRRSIDPTGADELTGTLAKKRKKIQGPPVYKQAWFWAVIGGVTAAAIIIPIVIPKPQKVLISNGKLY